MHKTDGLKLDNYYKYTKKVAFHTEYVMIKIRKRLRKATRYSEVQKMVSLKDIAKECGVSTATVSKALNGQHDIGEETKARVRETAERMGYFPNAAARALKTNRSYNVGVLFQEEAGSGLTHEYFSGVLNGIKVQVEKMGYDVTFINNSYGVKKTSFLNIADTGTLKESLSCVLILPARECLN